MAEEEIAPLTKERLFTMMAGYKATAVLRACVELGLFDPLAAGPATAGELAGRLGIDGQGVDERGLTALLASAAGVGLLLRDERGYALAPGAAELLVSTAPGYCGGIASVVASQPEWTALGQLAGTVRRGTPVPGVDLLAPDHPYWIDFAAHTTFVTTAMAGLVADALGDWAADREGLRVLDIGCGHGIFGWTLAERFAGAHIWAQDWPSVLDVAQLHAKRRGVADRATFLPGDALSTDLGGPYDVVVAANLLFHFSPTQARELVARMASVLRPDGRLVVAGFTTGDQPAPVEGHAALLGLLMLSATEGGSMYSTADYQRMLADQGLTESAVHTRPKLVPRVIVAHRPAAG